MKFSTFLKLSAAIYVARKFIQRSQRSKSTPLIAPQENLRLLQKAARVIRLPSAPQDIPMVISDGSGLQCPRTAKIYPYKDGVLYLLPDTVQKTATQKTLDTSFTAWAYDRSRDLILPLAKLPTFAQEVAWVQKNLQVKPGDTVLDLACGHGNFTVELSKRAGDDGLVIGLDLSKAMLARASERIRLWGLQNVLLVYGDAHQLPLADHCIEKLNCSGGFHQMPDLPKVLSELGRVGTAKAHLTTSTFMEIPGDYYAPIKRASAVNARLYFVPVQILKEQLAGLGFASFDWSMPGAGFGYVSASRA
jgi:ubiquinone/menaquinone biosynthesis C-methylase UbiE